MTTVMVEIAPPRPGDAGTKEDIVILDDVDTFARAATPGCGDDNPYN
ncbi:hypothetical protein [Streptomyces iranensis]|uniref:Uncharacterized protein n=1 Tax=Streptomyces iranensis TaxID=576784 RepID=A0A060ZY32_9ACTN|nr:hypothetical protein [Streptomyces iranensis]MBP2068379.1 hypothetical protein [Streptomyces iranensis]CDR08069.1 predicted protein [Streptomyces iranensis]